MTKVILEWLTPRFIRGIRSFLGLTQYEIRYIRVVVRSECLGQKAPLKMLKTYFQ